MAYEKSAGAIIYRIRRDDHGRRVPFYLLLRYPGEYWEFARGHMEKGEREYMTAQREIREETGLTGLRFLKGFREEYRFHFKRKGRTVTKDAVLYLAEAQRWRVETSEEHFGYVWVTHREALKHLHFENSQIVMRKARAFLDVRLRASEVSDSAPEKK
ncbi:MAG: NUDIX domain-containing protein [Candidatus Uhrbacteria bacterium]